MLPSSFSFSSSFSSFFSFFFPLFSHGNWLSLSLSLSLSLPLSLLFLSITLYSFLSFVYSLFLSLSLSLSLSLCLFPFCLLAPLVALPFIVAIIFPLLPSPSPAYAVSSLSLLSPSPLPPPLSSSVMCHSRGVSPITYLIVVKYILTKSLRTLDQRLRMTSRLTDTLLCLYNNCNTARDVGVKI